jgi:hypothetical protein
MGPLPGEGWGRERVVPPQAERARVRRSGAMIDRELRMTYVLNRWMERCYPSSK